MAASHGRRRSNTSPSISQAPRTARAPMPLESGEVADVARPWGKASRPTAEAPNLSGARSGRRQRGRTASRFCAPIREVPVSGTHTQFRRPSTTNSASPTGTSDPTPTQSRRCSTSSASIRSTSWPRRRLPAGILDALTVDGLAPGLEQLPPPATEDHALAELRALADSEHGRGVDDRAGLLRHADPAGAAPQHPGEPRLVHGLHAVPARDQPGPARGAAELPDHGRGPDRPRGRQRVDARRGHRRGRGHDADAPRRQGLGQPARRRRRRVLGRPRRCSTRAPSRSASRSSPPTCATDCPTASSSASSSSCPAPVAPSSTGRDLVAEAHDRGALVAVGADLLATDADHPARRDRRRRRLRHHPALRCANGIRRTARRLPRRAHQARPSAARPTGRRLGRRRRRARLPAGAADPRAAHPPRQGDQQHLHRAGAAGRDGRDVRQLPRRRRTHRRSRTACTATPLAVATGLRRGGRRGGARLVLRHRAGPGTGPRRRDPAAAKARGINVWLVDADHVSVACDEATTADHVEEVLAAFGATRGGPSLARSGDRHPHTDRSSPIRRSPATAPRPR